MVRRALKGLLEALLMRKPGRQGAELAAAEALRLSCTAVRELLCGEVGVHDLAMTGGLWRVTGAAIDAAATASASSGELPPDIHGPHAHLAIRLRQRDPGRRFVLGERIPYVLLAGAAGLASRLLPGTNRPEAAARLLGGRNRQGSTPACSLCEPLPRQLALRSSDLRSAWSIHSEVLVGFAIFCMHVGAMGVLFCYDLQLEFGQSFATTRSRAA